MQLDKKLYALFKKLERAYVEFRACARTRFFRKKEEESYKKSAGAVGAISRKNNHRVYLLGTHFRKILPTSVSLSCREQFFPHTRNAPYMVNVFNLLANYIPFFIGAFFFSHFFFLQTTSIIAARSTGPPSLVFCSSHVSSYNSPHARLDF